MCCVFVILFVINNEVMQISEARKLGQNIKCTSCIDANQVTEETGTTTPSQVPSPGTDAFRPTTPGHSPGVGHSIHE